MKRWICSLILLLTGIVSGAAEEEITYPRKLSCQISVEETFEVVPRPGWTVYPQRELALRFWSLLIRGPEDRFSLQLNFFCDTKDLARFDTPEKIDRAVLRGSVRLDRDATGKKHNLSWLSMVFPGSHAKLYMHSLGIISNCTANRDGDHWMEFEIPLKELRGKDVSALTGFVLFPGRQTEVVKHFRNLRLEY